MAYQYTTASGVTLIVPDTSIDVSVVSNPTGLATSGVIAIIGEADEGNSWSQDLAEGFKLSSNSYGPTDIARVTAKYGSGRLVDAFRGAAAPSASDRIPGSPNRIILVKTNNSQKAYFLTKDGHGKFTAKRGGQAGNDIQVAIQTSTSESAPSTGYFSYIPSALASSAKFRINGGSEQTISISADTTPAQLASLFTSASNMNAVGGVDRLVVSSKTASDTVELALLGGQNVEIKLAAGQLWSNAPQIGDTVRIPAGSVIEGGSAQNVGWYLVTATSNTSASASISAKKITSGAPVAVSTTNFSATPANDIKDYSFLKLDNMSGENRDSLSGLVGQLASASVVGSSLKFTLAAGQVFANSPKSGDLVYISSSSAFKGSSNENVGWYSVTSVSNSLSSAFAQMSRLSNGLPASVSSTAIVAVNDLAVFDKQLKGAGKSMEILDGGAAANLNTLFKQLGVDQSSQSVGALLTSSAELKKTANFKKGNQSETSPSLGGAVSLLIGYHGTTATCTITDSTFSTSVTGGDGVNLSFDLTKMASINDLATRINENAGYYASAFTIAEGQKSPSLLDKGTFGICSSATSKAGRIKRDAASFANDLGSSFAKYDLILKSGMPEDAGYTFLANGSKGATTGLEFSQAIDALQGVRCNFVVPLVSQDADKDAAIGQTEPGSTYTVDSINAAVKTHCISMSTAKIKRHRIGLVSKKDTFEAIKQSAGTMASFRVAHLFQDVIDSSNGELVQFQPWMGACKAAGMQAAGAYRSIFNKMVNISGAKQAAADFDDENISQLEDAISAGLIPLQRQETGGYTFVTDQLTYGVDNNVIYNSLQAVYVADLMALSLAESLKKAFVGESVADVNEGVALSFIKGKMAEFLAAKFIVPSPQQGAPAGWKFINVKVEGSVMLVEVGVIEATSIKFIPISLSIEGIKSSASSAGA